MKAILADPDIWHGCACPTGGFGASQKSTIILTEKNFFGG
jgi:hypothetical protein